MDSYFKKKEIMANTNIRPRSADSVEKPSVALIEPLVNVEKPVEKVNVESVKRCKLVKSTDLENFKSDIKKELSSVNNVLEFLKSNVEISENIKSLNESFKRNEENTLRNQNETNDKVKSLESQLKSIQEMID